MRELDIVCSLCLSLCQRMQWYPAVSQMMADIVELEVSSTDSESDSDIDRKSDNSMSTSHETTSTSTVISPTSEPVSPLS